MYRFYINNTDDEYHYLELGREFLPDDGFEVIPYTGASLNGLLTGKSFFVNPGNSPDRDEIKREMYGLLSNITDIRPPWGTLTGVRPLKPAIEAAGKSSIRGMEKEMSERYLISPEKASLLSDIVSYQLENVEGVPWERASVYAGIPFCPTRCAYCSFASNVAPPEDRAVYLADLIRETEYAGRLAEEHGTGIESVYIGGGTPTTLSAGQLTELITAVSESFDIDPETMEFTVEAGRPDTITADKLSAMRSLGISRISINPQTMKDGTLRLIGRDHSAEDIREAYRMASGAGFDVINADLIAGLPGEDEKDFGRSLREIIGLGANNITIHTLSVKRGSRLKESDPDYYRKNTETVSHMLDISRRVLSEAGFRPYYIYRQKHQIAALENTGWCRPGKHSIYNIRIMEDKQTVIGLGAGAVGKVYHPGEDRIERIANVSDYKIYSGRFNEMLARKDEYYR